MTEKELNERWKKWRKKEYKIMVEGLKNGTIRTYNEDEIIKGRDIFYKGLPASVTLLSYHLCNGRCIEMSVLASRLFINDENTKDLKIIISDVDSLRLNPALMSRGKDYAKHYVLYRETNDGEKLIYDTTEGLAFKPDIWYKLESPTDMYMVSKEDLIKIDENTKNEKPELIKVDPLQASIILPDIEQHYKDYEEQYSWEGVELLQREVELFKERINYDNFCQNNFTEIYRLRLKHKQDKENKN